MAKRIKIPQNVEKVVGQYQQPHVCPFTVKNCEYCPNMMCSERYVKAENPLNGVVYELTAWSAIQALGIKPYRDGNRWCFLYGENIQDGVCGFGATIKEAALDFYSNISFGL